jgi:hypothetical protein
VIATALAWLVAVSCAAAAPEPAVQAAAPAASAASAAATHRPLRENRSAEIPEPTEPEAFDGYPAAQPYTVVPRKALMVLYPCGQCHKLLPPNARPRKLVGAPHVAALRHGKGRIWCMECHLGPDQDMLRAAGGARIDFDDSHLLCGTCHGARQRDWTFGAHGKRVAGWSGERLLYACTHCHDPHDPTTAPRAPTRPPALRAGLAPMPRAAPRPLPFWAKQTGAKP